MALTSGETLRQLLKAYDASPKLSRRAAERQEGRSVNPRNGLIDHAQTTDAAGDDYQLQVFEDGSLEVWRRWDRPDEWRLIVYRGKRWNTRYYWAEDSGR